MRFLWRWIKRGLILLVVLVLGLLAPVGYVELACRAKAENEAYTALIAPEHRRDEAASFLTYPEWHIVFAYDDYARILEDGDPHDFGYFRAISGFWSAMCNLTQTADKHGGAVDIKNMDYVIGVSFTAELLAKAQLLEILCHKTVQWSSHSAITTGRPLPTRAPSTWSTRTALRVRRA